MLKSVAQFASLSRNLWLAFASVAVGLTIMLYKGREFVEQLSTHIILRGGPLLFEVGQSWGRHGTSAKF
jgi:hypothetical protein